MSAEQPDRASGPVVVVTGAAGLVGRQIVEALERRGAVTVGWDVAGTAGNPAAGGYPVVEVDVADDAAVRSACSDAAERYSGIDALVHAAAITGRSPSMARHTLLDVDLGLWDQILRVNLTGALVCAREIGSRLRPGPLAQLALIGSIQGSVPTMGHSAYAVSKAALVGLSRQLAAEFAADGVRVNLFTLGPIAELDQIRAPSTVAPTPLGRFGEAAEIGEAIADLVLGPFSYLTGAIVPLDGGEQLRPRTGPERRYPDA